MSILTSSRRSSISRSSTGESTSNEQYYVFQTPERRRGSLHVIDAEHGVFEQSPPSRSGLNIFKPKNVIRKLKNGNGKKSNGNFLVLSENEEGGLRAEPELVESVRYNNKSNNSSRNGNIPDLFNSNSTNSTTIIDDSTSDSDEFIEPYSIRQENETEIISKEKKSRNPLKSLSSSSSSKKKSKHTKSLVVSEQVTTSLKDASFDHKSRIEIEYEKAKLKAERYRNQRDYQILKNEREKFVQNLKEYEYYKVNGLHNPSLNSDQNNYQSQQNQLKYNNSYMENSIQPKTTKKKSRRSKSTYKEIIYTQEPDFFSNLYDTSPSLLQEFYLWLEEYVPSNQTAREFNNSTQKFLYNIPAVGFISFFIYLLGRFIPQQSRRKWSVRALVVCLINSLLLFIIGRLIFKFVSSAYSIYSACYNILKFFRLI